MGVYYRWLCDERREYFDPGELLGPRCPQGGYGIEVVSIPYSAWVVGLLMTERWSGCQVRLVGDGGDEYECEGYDDVAQHVLRNLLQDAPLDGLRFLACEVCHAADETFVEDLPKLQEEEGVRRARYLKILTEYAREDWPPRCADETCLGFGERHQGDHRPAPPIAEPEYVSRQYVMGLGRAEVEPGVEVALSAEMTSDFRMTALLRMTALHCGEDVQRFTIVRVSVGGGESFTVLDVPASLAALAPGGLPIEATIKTCQKIEVVFRNTSDVRARIGAAVLGWVRTKNPKWLPPG